MKGSWPGHVSRFRNIGDPSGRAPLEGCDRLLHRARDAFSPGCAQRHRQGVSWSQSRLVRVANFQTEPRKRTMTIDRTAPFQKRGGSLATCSDPSRPFPSGARAPS